MTHESEASRGWHVRPSTYNQPGWWTVGYPYAGAQSDRQGEFVPVHHWAGKAEADAFCAALLEGCSRFEAIRRAVDV